MRKRNKKKVHTVWQHGGEDGMNQVQWFTTKKAARRFARKLRREAMAFLARSDKPWWPEMRPHWIKRIRIATSKGRDWWKQFDKDMEEEAEWDRRAGYGH
jgi:hypothetical protein